MSKVKFTEQDVGRKFEREDGRIFKILRIDFSVTNPVITECLKDEVNGNVGQHYRYPIEFETGNGGAIESVKFLDEEKKGVKITEKDVGRKFRVYNNCTAEIIAFHKITDRPVSAKLKLQYGYPDAFIDIYLSVNGKGFWNGNRWAEYDFKEWIEEEKEDKKMEENLKEKYSKLIGQTFITKNDDDGDDEITISYVTDSHVYFNSRRHEEEFNATLEEFSKIVIHKSESQEEQEEETAHLPWEDDPESAGKYELRMTVVDAKKSSTTDKCYYDSLADIGSHVFGVTRGIIDLDKPGTDRSTLLFLLREKGDVVKITRQINISSVNVAVVVIRVTQLKD